MGFGRVILRQLRPILSDRFYIHSYFYCKTGYKLHLESPKTFNEKLQWLKFYDRRAEYTRMVDKIEVKGYVTEIIGYEYVIPTLAVYDSVEDINYDDLPNQFVLKCTHDSGGVVICKDKKTFDKESAARKLKRGETHNYYKYSLEYPYKDVVPRIIAEEFVSNNGSDVCDYKVHCFNGEPKLVLVCKDRFADDGLTEDFFTESWEHLPLRRPGHPNSVTSITKPDQLDEMLSLAKKLSDGIPFVRVDFYVSEGKLLFGELTFFPASGFAPFVPATYDSLFGSWLQLPAKRQ